jgi:hypothetical protein
MATTAARQVGQPLPPAKDGSFDSHAFSAAATFELLGFRPFRNLSAPEEPPVGGDVGRAVGIGSPCDFMQLRNDASADLKPPNPPPNPPPDGRSDAQALLAFWNVLLLADDPPKPPPKPPPPKPPPPKPPEGEADGRVVGTFTPCWRRQLRYALKPDEDELPAAVLADVAPQPATSSAASPRAAATHTTRPPRLPKRTRTCIFFTSAAPPAAGPDSLPSVDERAQLDSAMVHRTVERRLSANCGLSGLRHRNAPTLNWLAKCARLGTGKGVRADRLSRLAGGGLAHRRGLLGPAIGARRLRTSRVAARRSALCRFGAAGRAFGRRPIRPVCRAFLRGWHAARAVPAVGPVEPGALEDDADRREDLAELATTGTANSQRVVGKPLHDLGPVSALGAGVLVRRHNSSLCGVSTRRGQLLNGSNG